MRYFLLLLILVLAIGLTPRIPVGTFEGLGRIIEIRGEDIWIIFLALIWIVAFLKSRQREFEKPPLFFPIVFWLGIGFLSLLINWASGNVSIPRGFFYFAKELQFFFVYFFTFFHLREERATKALIQVWLLVGLANIAWVLTQLFVIGKGGEYGTSALAEWGVFPTGAFFLLLFIFLFNWWLYSFWRKNSWQKEYLYLVAVLSIIIGIFGSLSKTIFIGFWFALFVSMLLYFFTERTLKTAFSLTLLFTGVSLFALGVYFFLILPNLVYAKRLITDLVPKKIIDSAYRTRVEPITIPQYHAAVSRPVLNIIFGSGKGVILLTTESHNQYLRNFVETGIAGSIAFFWLIFVIFRYAWKGFRQKDEKIVNCLSAGVIVATLTMLFMSFIVDAFSVVKPNMTYWFFLGLTMAVLSNYGREKEKGN